MSKELNPSPCAWCSHKEVCKESNKFLEVARNVYYAVKESDIMSVEIKCKHFLKPQTSIRNPIRCSDNNA